MPLAAPGGWARAGGRITPDVGAVTFTGTVRQMARERQALREESAVEFLDWSVSIPEPKTGTLDFNRFPFQPELYEVFGGPYRNAVGMKSAQVGASGCTARVAIYSADVLGENALYVFPTKEDMWDFVSDRVDGMIERSEYLQSRVGGIAQQKRGADNKGLKRIGLGNVYFRGSNAKSGLQSAAIDLLVLDEYDQLTMKHIPDAERRISGSLNGRIRRIGYPSYPDYGMHDKWVESDQRIWLVQCRNCNFIGKPIEEDQPLVHPRGRGWQPLHFFENVDQDRRELVCGGCGEPIDAREGRWVAQRPQSRIPGFHISRLMVPTVFVEQQDGTKPIDDMIKASKSRDDFEIQAFWNLDLGLPYEPKEGRITLASLTAARSLDIEWVQQPGYAGPNIVTMGVDVATVRSLNVRISEHLGDERSRKRALFIGEIDDDPEDGGKDAFTKLCDLMDYYQVNMACVDHEPDGRLARALAARYKGRAYVIAYSGTAKDAISVDVEQSMVVVQRTRAMDATRKVMAEQRNILPQNLPEDYIRQMRAPVRKLKENDLGEKVAYYESKSPDDYYHAETYDLVARDVLVAQMEIEEAQRDVETPLDSMIPFKRSVVDDLQSVDWSAGPGEDGISLGPSLEGEDEDDEDGDAWG